jgi:hypothetical protein
LPNSPLQHELDRQVRALAIGKFNLAPKMGDSELAQRYLTMLNEEIEVWLKYK